MVSSSDLLVVEVISDLREERMTIKSEFDVSFSNFTFHVSWLELIIPAIHADCPVCGRECNVYKDPKGIQWVHCLKCIGGSESTYPHVVIRDQEILRFAGQREAFLRQQQAVTAP